MDYFKNLPKDLRGTLKLSVRLAGRMGCRVFVAGGFVRDIILKKDNLDVDIVIEGDGGVFAEKLARELKAALVRHRRFGTATVTLPDNFKIDVATARKEVYNAPAELPLVSAGDIKSDLFRRDFSINAMALELGLKGAQNLIDLFSGRADLKKGLVRVLHERSFIDDPTRILRAVRFEQRYGFKIEPRTLKLLSAAKGLGMLEMVQKHRVRDEMILILKEKDPVKAVRRLNSLYGLSFIHSRIRLKKEHFALMSSITALGGLFRKEFPSKRRLDIWLMYLMVILDGLSLQELNRFGGDFALRKGELMRLRSAKIDVPRIKRILSSKKNVSASAVYKQLQPFSYEVILLAHLRSSSTLLRRRIMDFLRHHNETKLMVSGEDILKLGLSAGPHFRVILNQTLSAKINGELKTREDELRYIAARIKQQNIPSGG